jgi:2-polyprenyl-3-methyl-5-hydroxy-6-metoxy-1,4-benzoquinol methylase
MEYENDYEFNSKVSKIYKERIAPYVKNYKVLDLGCAGGEYLQHFSSDSLGLDFSDNNLEKVKSLGLRALKVDLNNLPSLNEKFDVVFASHILEHVENPINLLRFCNKSLKRDGIIILSLPNEQSLIHYLYPYFTNDGNHLYAFTEDNIRELLQYTNFEVKDFFYEYNTALTKKLYLDSMLQIVDYMPDVLKRKIGWAHWCIAKKI